MGSLPPPAAGARRSCESGGFKIAQKASSFTTSHDELFGKVG